MKLRKKALRSLECPEKSGPAALTAFLNGWERDLLSTVRVQGRSRAPRKRVDPDPLDEQSEAPTKGRYMQITSFKDLYIAELQELTSLEGQLGKALRRMAEVASHPSLKNALMHHREQTQVQKQRLESILQKHSANPRAHTDQAMQALINETEKMITMVKGDDLRDAALIASAQKVKHYEIAAYGTAAALAG